MSGGRVFDYGSGIGYTIDRRSGPAGRRRTDPRPHTRPTLADVHAAGHAVGTIAVGAWMCPGAVALLRFEFAEGVVSHALVIADDLALEAATLWPSAPIVRMRADGSVAPVIAPPQEDR